MDENKNNQNKEHVLNEMNDYISSTMSIPVIKLDENNEVIKPKETTEDHSEVTEIYSTTVSEEKSDLGREMFAPPTPTTPVEEKEVPQEETPVVEEKKEEPEVKMEAPTPAPVVEEEKTPEPTPQVEEAKSEMNAMNVTEQTHVDFSEPKVKKKSKMPVVVGVLVLLIALGALGYFVIYPMIQSKFMSNPKNVFEATIKDSAKNVNAMLDSVPITNAMYDINFKINSNVEGLSSFSGYTYGIKAGADVDKKAMEASIYMKDGEKNYYLSTYLKDGKDYFKLSNRDQLLDLGSSMSETEITEMFNELQELFSGAGATNEDVQYLVTKVADLYVESLDEKKLSQTKESIDFNGTKVSVEKNTYLMDKENAIRTANFILDGLEKDERANKILTELFGTDLKSVKEEINANKDQIEMPAAKINIYTAGRKKDVVGYSIEVDNKEILHYYFDAKGFEFKVNDVTFTEGVEVTAETNIDLKITGIKDGSKTNVSIKVDDEEVATMVVNKWDEKGIDLTYVINLGENKVNGTLKVTIDKGNDYRKTNVVFSIDSGSDRLSVEANVDISTNAKVADIDTSTAYAPSDTELDMIMNEFIGSLRDTPVGALLGSLSSMYDTDADSSLNQYYGENVGTDPMQDDYIITA